jgi:hypothetical protein
MFLLDDTPRRDMKKQSKLSAYLLAQFGGPVWGKALPNLSLALPSFPVCLAATLL